MQSASETRTTEAPVESQSNTRGLVLHQCATEEQLQDPNRDSWLLDCSRDDDVMRPRLRPTLAPETSNRPKRRPTGAPVTSERPVPRPGSTLAMDAGEATTEKDPLAGVLEVVDGEATRPNQVTAEEYAYYTDLFEQIGAGNTNFLFDDGSDVMDPESFKAAFMRDLATIFTTDQGRGLVNELATADDGIDFKVVMGALAETEAGLATDFDEEAAGNGVGTHAGVFYAPDTVQDFRYGALTDEDWARMTSDTMLFHELVHAWETHQGIKGDRGPVGELATGAHDHGVRLDEYDAIGLAGRGGQYTENAYRAERDQLTLESIPQRTSYNGDTPAERMKPIPDALR